jgi:uncharacterized protein YdeI (YjbR/CyaY-like superfamily)
MKIDPRIDALIAKAAPFAQPILTHLRALTHKALPDAEETIKWGMPHFTLGGKNIAGMAAFKAHAAFMIHGDGRQGEAMGQYGKLTSLADLPDDAALTAKLHDARDRLTSGVKVPKAKPAAKAEIPMPDDFAEALAQNGQASVHFDGFAPSQRREYLEWITEAKRDETRAKRLVQAVEWIAEGKKRNWKYESC